MKFGRAPTIWNIFNDVSDQACSLRYSRAFVLPYTMGLRFCPSLTDHGGHLKPSCLVAGATPTQATILRTMASREVSAPRSVPRELLIKSRESESRVGKKYCVASIEKLRVTPKRIAKNIARRTVIKRAKYAEKQIPSGTKPHTLSSMSFQKGQSKVSGLQNASKNGGCRTT